MTVIQTEDRVWYCIPDGWPVREVETVLAEGLSTEAAEEMVRSLYLAEAVLRS